MGTKYPTQSISGYNASPPADDGTQVEANKIKWVTHKDKLTDPVKTLAEAIDTALVTYVDRQPTLKSTAYTTALTDHLKIIETTGTTTITLGAVATMGSGYTVTVKNAGVGVVTIEGSGSETIDGDLNRTLNENASATCVVDNATGSYLVSGTYGAFQPGTLMLFQQTTAPSGWTKQVTHNDKAFRVVSGTASSGGTKAFTTTFGSGKTSDSHTLLTAEIPSHTHGSAGAHTHTVPVAPFTSSGTVGATANDNGAGADKSSGSAGAHTHTSVGGDTGHTHALSNFDLQYVDIIIASKD